MSHEMQLNLIRRKRWTLIVLLLSATLLVGASLIHLRDTQPPIMVKGSTLQFQDLDSLVIKPTGGKSNVPVPLERSQTGPLPQNSVERDKNNNSNLTNEGFTVIMLTNQNRILDLSNTLVNLNGLPGLKQVILIWNGEKPATKIETRELNFPVQVLSNGRNSLNNRFLPLESIETDAILSMDDDMFPSQESILFAFRIWQEYPERIVGFPGRGVVWTEGRWKYDPHPCSISMVLTGLAFFHQKYLSLYTYEMDPEIRNRVDNITNCEDIAMNFLVSHLTQKPPIKVTPANSWVCRGCDRSETGKVALWKDAKHFEERDACINFFAKVYGYAPLFKSEYRFDDHLMGDGDGPRIAHCARLPIPIHTMHILVISFKSFSLIIVASSILLICYYFASYRHRRNSLR